LPADIRNQAKFNFLEIKPRPKDFKSAALMIRFFRVKGESMLPLLAEGDLALAVNWYWLTGPLKVGDIVVFRHFMYGTLVKQVDRLLTETGRLTVRGTRAVSLDSQEFGPVAQTDVLGKVVWRVRRAARDRRPGVG
jgi:signal peptidase I